MTTRYIYDAELAPVAGSTFQPTGFPDIGAATFTRYENGHRVNALLVESTQSMARRLKATAWDSATNQPVDAVTGLPWVRVVRAGTGEFLTSSRLEAHRLASPFVHTSTFDGQSMFEVIKTRLGLAADTPLNYPAMAAAVAQLDPFCLVHGVFFSHKNWPGQPKFMRAVTSVIEAHDVEPAVSGGRKADHVRHHLEKDGEGGTAEGYGSVPFSRTEWTARRIVASFVVDVELLRSYGLPEAATEALETLALWEIRHLLDGGLRLRTACDLDVTSGVTARRGPDLPTADDSTERLQRLISDSAATFGDGAALNVEWSGKKS
ncbi:type I-U CRISPR-associated RAMP protein Csb1/Cas7u [Mycobacterium sp. MYCO198283]|uniref:type I-G CRISPR-associated RAMP protein Csb1/Cas7g n=1 Tax=Mycobacterium sp. MYCO198283 TaxID=2883505 RepID=UPI001E417F01|nr:type I-U CRISPR-associated RAMP protein Csb1/Cas7u [Mycobacterium sp. MYCO198283]MCG5432772.1 type I-U CRISPR-associated RAMP protein Csb1/Cas7u [Mycobacterium sp. MYCO198283]